MAGELEAFKDFQLQLIVDLDLSYSRIRVVGLVQRWKVCEAVRIMKSYLDITTGALMPTSSDAGEHLSVVASEKGVVELKDVAILKIDLGKAIEV